MTLTGLAAEPDLLAFTTAYEDAQRIMGVVAGRKLHWLRKSEIDELLELGPRGLACAEKGDIEGLRALTVRVRKMVDAVSKRARRAQKVT